MKWLALAVLIAGLVGVSLFALDIPAVEAPASPENQTSTREDVTILGRNLVTVYDGITVSSNVTELDVSNRNLTGSLKAEINQLQNLRTLNISGNNFTGLPAEVGQLTNLEVLNLANNPLTGLPYEIGNLSNLQVLDLRNTNYSEADLEVIKKQLSPDTKVITGADSAGNTNSTSSESTD